eukprot:4217878-Amphidinium_carterae.1
MTALIVFGIQKNSFTGALPESGIATWSLVSCFAIFVNRFTATLPVSIRGMRALKWFGIEANKFKGALPES